MRVPPARIACFALQLLASQRFPGSGFPTLFSFLSVLFPLIYFYFIFFFWCAWKRTAGIDQPCGILQCSGGGGRTCPPPPRGLTSAQVPQLLPGFGSPQPQEVFTHKGRCELAFLLGQGNSKLSEMSVLQPSAPSPKDATTNPVKRRQGFKSAGMFVSSPLLGISSCLLSSFRGKANCCPGPPSFLGRAQHHAGLGAALFCLRRRA